MNQKTSLAIVIPMYNEETNVANSLKKIFSEVLKIKHPIIIVAVNDGSTDNTYSILSAMKIKYKSKLVIVSYSKNKGYGKALQEGIAKASELGSGYILFMDSDLTNNPKDIRYFVEKIKENPDCVKASRYIKSGGVKLVPLKRQIISRVGNFAAKLCFNMNINDYTNGFRMTKVSKLKKMKFHENSFAIILEELYYLKKGEAKILEIPVILTSRKSSKSSFTYKPSTFYNYGKYAIKALLV